MPFARLAVLAAVLGGVGACSGTPTHEPTDFARLAGWTSDRHGEAAATLVESCAAFARLPDDATIVYPGFTGTVADWRPICAALNAVGSDHHGAARAFFERWFVPVSVADPGADDGRSGLFTGYYIPTLNGSWTPTERFRVPVYGLPPADLAGHPRSAIARGALAGRRLEILWVDDPVDLFFMHIQGSGRVVLPDGRTVTLGYAGANGHSYTSIGRVLIDRGEATLDDMSMAFLREWMARNPHRAEALMDANASYVYFSLLEGPALGALGRPLTAERSIAIDKRIWTLGTPFWVDVRDIPDAEGRGRKDRLRRLMIAQDTGGAIRGPVRADVFWGYGAAAGLRAGAMRAKGRYWALVPRIVVERGAPGAATVVAAAPAR